MSDSWTNTFETRGRTVELQTCSLEISSFQLGEVPGFGSILLTIGVFQEYVSMRVD